ncbi:putative membrane protein [Morganella morganii]|nr:putative membrane protein [Morganella morganii]EMP51287.1 hypothetical protein C790_01202 [Morganella morganii SC01]
MIPAIIVVFFMSVPQVVLFAVFLVITIPVINNTDIYLVSSFFM